MFETQFQISKDINITMYEDNDFIDIIQDNPLSKHGCESVTITKKELLKILAILNEQEYFNKKIDNAEDEIEYIDYEECLDLE